MSEFRKLLDIIAENTSAGSVAVVAQPLGATQRRVKEQEEVAEVEDSKDTQDEESSKFKNAPKTEAVAAASDYGSPKAPAKEPESKDSHGTPDAPKVIEYGNWENSALVTTEKVKAKRTGTKSKDGSVYTKKLEKKTTESKKKVDESLAVAVKEGVEDRTSYQVAKVLYDHGIKYDPARERELIDAINMAMIKKMAMTPKEARAVMRDEDFLGDTMSELRHMEQGVAEGMDSGKRARLDDLIDQYRTATDPEAYYGLDGEYEDPEEVLNMIRAEFGDRVAGQIEAGTDKMHFPRKDHGQGYDPMSWKEPVDRITKAGKMYKQDSDYRKNIIKSRYRLSGKSVAEGQLAELKKSTVKSYANKKQAELDDVPPMPFKKSAMSKAEHERAAKGMMGALARLSGKKPTSEGVAESILDMPAAQDTPAANAIIRRILIQRTDLLAKYGPEKVGAAIDDVSDRVGDVEEIGTSDVSAWIRQVEQILRNTEHGVMEGKENSPAAEAIFDRIITTRPELFTRYGDEVVADCVYALADNIADSDEISSGDVDGWVERIVQDLEADILDESSHGSINDDDWYEIDADGKIVKQSGPQSYSPAFGVKVIKLANGNRVVRGMTGKTQGLFSGLEEGKTGPGLWANIHAKRERIKHGSGERMRKPGSKGAPTDKNLKSARADEATDLKSIPEADDEKIADRYDPRDFDAMVDRLGKLAKEQDSRLGPVDLAKLAKLLHGREQTNESSLEEERMLAKELIKRAELFKRGKARDLGEKPTDRAIQKKSVNLEDLDANQKRVGQLGPTTPVKNNNIGKLVGANEGIEDIRRLAGLNSKDE